MRRTRARQWTKYLPLTMRLMKWHFFLNTYQFAPFPNVTHSSDLQLHLIFIPETSCRVLISHVSDHIWLISHLSGKFRIMRGCKESDAPSMPTHFELRRTSVNLHLQLVHVISCKHQKNSIAQDSMLVCITQKKSPNFFCVFSSFHVFYFCGVTWMETLQLHPIHASRRMPPDKSAEPICWNNYTLTFLYSICTKWFSIHDYNNIDDDCEFPRKQNIFRFAIRLRNASALPQCMRLIHTQFELYSQTESFFGIFPLFGQANLNENYANYKLHGKWNFEFHFARRSEISLVFWTPNQWTWHKFSLSKKYSNSEAVQRCFIFLKFIFTKSRRWIWFDDRSKQNCRKYSKQF